MRYVIINNHDNTVIEVVDWDGDPATKPERAIDTSMQPLPADLTPAPGDIWDGTKFTTPPPPPAEPPPGEDVDPGYRRKARKSLGEDEDA